MATKFFWNAYNYELQTEICGTLVVEGSISAFHSLNEYLQGHLEWSDDDYVIRALNAIQVIGMESVH